jgi:P pilus assembly chaperone PapD
MASVVMTGTRIIYASQLKEKSVQLRNTGKEPYIVQVQIDDGSAENKASDSFVITPPIFRMEPGSGQSVRLMFTGKQLPQDRESLFYMNFTQLPVSQAKEQGNNQLVLAITNRVKVFYRPQGVTGQQSATGQALSLTKVGNKIKVNNPTGYYAVIRQASLLINGQQIKLADSVMIPPKSSAEWTPSQPITSLTGAHLKLILVNDYGMDVESARIL